ncbi:acyltransferase [Nocardia terpenica]|uniref:Acyltransferase n=1 Tax=Nocardia terpenica TaxID=455432 RepID=A0A291REX1_9NOCA|nr:acyltransferase [Nocardia terpenica]ATL65684.1 acyltransferase [Nocardia terpenica]
MSLAVDITTAAPIDPAPRKSVRPYLHQIDLFRILTFACVIAVHVIGGSTDPGSVSGNGVLVLLHFTREAFFALTGFVLVYQYADRPVTALHFWRKRFALVGIPYVAWSLIYWGYSVGAGLQRETAAESLRRLGFELVTGGAWYHLYFLLVTMQAYVLFPLLLRVLRATAGRHRWLLAASAALQLGCLWWLVHPPTLTGVAAGIWDHLSVTILPYQFYVLLGAVAACHIDAVNRTVRRFGPLFVAGAVVAVALSEWDYLRSTRLGMPPWQASDVFLPHLPVCFVGIIALLYTVSSWWAARREGHRWLARAVRYGSDRSFGVFLIHPLMLQLLAPVIPWLHRVFGVGWGTVLLYLCVLALAVAGAEVVRRLPVSLWLVGRPMLRFRPKASAQHAGRR